MQIGIVWISLVFGTLAGLCAFLISYREYQHHFADPAQARRIALEFGLTAFGFFAVLSALTLWLFPSVFRFDFGG